LITWARNRTRSKPCMQAKQYDAFAPLSNHSIGFTSADKDRPSSDTNMLRTAPTGTPHQHPVLGRTNFRTRKPPASPYSCAAFAARDTKQQHNVVKAVDELTLADHCKDRRTALLLSLTVLTGSFLVGKDAQAIPLAPLGKGSDTIGGPKLQQPSLKQVQVLPPVLLRLIKLLLRMLSHIKVCTVIQVV